MRSRGEAVLYLGAAAVAFVVVVVTVVWTIAARERVPPRVRYSRALLCGGFAVGTVTHLENVLRHGLVPAPDQPLGFNLFWSALAIVDPLVVLLLVFRPRAGLVAAAIIMAADLSINVAAMYGTGPSLAALWPLAFQTVFALFLVVAAPRCWRASTR